MRKIVNINKRIFSNLMVLLFKDNGITFLLLFLFLTCQAQNETMITPADSIAFADSVKTWLPNHHLDSLADWQVNTAAGVAGEKITQLSVLLNQYCAELSAKRLTGEEALAMAMQDSTVAKEIVKQLKDNLKTAKAGERKGKQALKESSSAVAFSEKTNAMPPQDRRKNLSKLIKKGNSLQQTWNILTAPPPPAPEPSAPVVQLPPPEPDTIATPTTEEPGKEKPQKKKMKEKLPEKPHFSKYNPANDVMLNPPQPTCKLGVNRRDEFTGNVYREMQYAELFRYTNAVMKKILPASQPHITCKAALASDASGGVLLLQFTIKDATARRSFGGLPAKSIVSLKFINGEIITLFNESNQEVRFDAEQGVAVFTGQYPFQSGVFKKLEKMELDQIRVAWSTGYEDYNVQQVGLLQQQASCLK